MTNPDLIKRLLSRIEQMVQLSLDRGMSEDSAVDLICGQLGGEDIKLLARHAIEQRLCQAVNERA